jgi:hypothetical protein
MIIRITKASSDDYEKYIQTNNLEDSLRELYKKYRKKLILNFEDVNEPAEYWKQGADVCIIVYDDWLE